MVSSLNVDKICRLLDDQTARLWAWILFKDTFDLSQPRLLNLADLREIERKVENRLNSLRNDDMRGVLFRCAVQITFLNHFAQHGNADVLRQQTSAFPTLRHFERTVTSTMRYGWYNRSLKHLSLLASTLRAFLAIHGTLPCLVAGVYECNYVCWDCRFTRIVTANTTDHRDNDDEEGDKEEDDEEEGEDPPTKLGSSGCDHLIFFEPGPIVEHAQPDSFDVSVTPSQMSDAQRLRDRAEWALELRRRERVRETRRKILMEINAEKRKILEALSRLKRPKQLALTCFHRVLHFLHRLDRSKEASGRFESADLLTFCRIEKARFRERLERLLSVDSDRKALVHRSLQRWVDLFVTLPSRPSVGAECVIRAIWLCEPTTSSQLVHGRLEELKERSPLRAFSPSPKPAFALSNFFDAVLYLSSLEKIVGVEWGIVTVEQLESHPNGDIVVFHHLADDKEREPWGLSLRLRDGTLKQFRADVVSLSLFLLQRVARPNDALRYLLKVEH